MAKDSNGTTTELCTRCQQKPRAQGHDWCLECKRMKQTEYNEARDSMMERRGYIRGAAAMREQIAKRLDALGLGYLTGMECARWVMNEPLPVHSGGVHDAGHQDTAAVGVS